MALILFIIGLPIVIATAMVQEGPPGRGDDRASGAATVPPPSGSMASAPAPTTTPADAPAPPPAVARLFTWNRAITGGVLAFAALGLAATGFMGMRSLGIGPAATLFSSGALEAGEPIVLADFGGAEEVAPVVTEALRVDLAASPAVELLPPDRVREALERMRRNPAEPLSREAARELAVREGHTAVIAGEVARLAGSYVLTAEVVAADGGAVLASFRETARDSTGLIDAVDALSASIRGKVGESLRSVRARPPLARYTTSSLEALHRYAEGVRLIDREARSRDGIAAFEEAVRLDPEFAMAWRKIGVEYSNMGVQPGRRDEALTRAYELADRLPDRERGLAEGSYHMTVTNDPTAAGAALRRVAERFNDGIAYNNLAVVLGQTGDWAGAEVAARAALRHDPGPTNYNNLVVALYGQGRVDDARAAIREGLDAYPDHPAVFSTHIMLPFAEGDPAEALARLDSILDGSDHDPIARARGHLARANIMLSLGRIEEAFRSYDMVGDLARRVGFHREWQLLQVDRARVQAWLLGDVARARSLLDDALRTRPLDSLPPADRPHLALAETYALLGDTAAAAAQIRGWETTSAATTRPAEVVPVRGWIALAADRTDEAVALFRESAAADCTICGLPQLGIAYRQAGAADSARAVLERYVEERFLFRANIDGMFLAPSLEALAELHADAGNAEEAARYYGRFIDLWENADPGLQPRVETARARLAALVERRG